MQTAQVIKRPESHNKPKKRNIDTNDLTSSNCAYGLFCLKFGF